MNASRVGVLAAVTGAVAWGLKAVAIGVAGGLDQSPFEGPLFLLGLVAVVVAFVSLGVAVAGERPLVVKALGGVVGVVVGLGLTALMSMLAEAAIPESAGWVRAEAGLWFLALLALGLTAFWHSRRGTPRAAGRPAHPAV